MNTITYCSDTRWLDPQSIYDAAYGSLPRYRREKVDGFVFMKDKKLSIGVELLLRKALSDLGEEMHDIELVKNNKPVLRGSDIHFNLSHSGTKVMCSVSDDDVGCDVEKIAPIDLDIARRFFFGSEYERIASANDEDRYDLFYRFWTLKESFMKVTGLGFELPLDSFRISLDDGISVDQDVDDRTYHFREFYLNDGYRYACCSINEHIDDIIQVRLDEILNV